MSIVRGVSFLPWDPASVGFLADTCAVTCHSSNTPTGISFGRELAALPVGIAFGLVLNAFLDERNIKAQPIAAVLAALAGLFAAGWMVQVFDNLRTSHSASSIWEVPLVFVAWGAACGVVVATDPRIQKYRWHGMGGLLVLAVLMFILL